MILLFNSMENLKIGFIGQGFIGKNYADDFEDRGYAVVRYSLEKEYVGNKEKIKDCQIVFVAVNTPTKQDGVDFSLLEEVLPLVGAGNIAVIKSTLLPGTTKRLQSLYPELYVMHSPEFLREVSAKLDAKFPERNIIGIPDMSELYFEKAKSVMSTLPKAPFELICSSEEAELIKYAGNLFLTLKVVYMNMIYDVSSLHGSDWSVIRSAITHDSRIGSSHTEPVHVSGRGAGGNCFIKDLAGFRIFCESLKLEDPYTVQLLKSVEKKNNSLLISSGKDIDLLRKVYGESFPNLN